MSTRPHPKASADRPTDGRRYFPALDGLRCLAAIGVVLAHVGTAFPPSRRLLAYGGAIILPGLLVFFLISGFLVYRPFVRANLARGQVGSPAARPRRHDTFWVFLARRILRIFPLYWTVLTAKILLFGPGEVTTVVDWVQIYLLLPLPNPELLFTGGLGIAMWTLAVELPFYLFLPLYSAGVSRLSRRFRDRVPAITVELACVGSVLLILLVTAVVSNNPAAYRIMSLPVGMVLAIGETWQSLHRRAFAWIRWLAAQWQLCLLAVLLAWVIGGEVAFSRGTDDLFTSQEGVMFPLQLVLALALFIPATFGSPRQSFIRLLSSRPIQRLALLTYGIYLWHTVVLLYTPDLVGEALIPLIAVTVAITTALAGLTFLGVERPAKYLREALEERSRATEPASQSARRSPPALS